MKIVPEGNRFLGIRLMLLRWCGAQVGRGVTICSSARIEGWGRLILEDGVKIGPHAYLCAGGWPKGTGIKTSTLRIGSNTRVAHFVSLKTSTHEIDIAGPCSGGEDSFSDITIGKGCWICASAVVVPGVTIGDRCVVGAGGVVVKDVPDYSLVAGVPARIVKQYIQ